MTKQGQEHDKTWILVADEAIARFLELPDDGGDLQEVGALADPDAHAREAELRRDAYGRRSGSPAQHGSGTVSSAGEDASRREAERFARRVAGYLGDARRSHRFAHLRVVAAPRFLGKLRQALPREVADVVVDDLDKDLAHLDAQALTRALYPRPPTGPQAA